MIVFTIQKNPENIYREYAVNRLSGASYRLVNVLSFLRYVLIFFMDVNFN